MRIFIFSDIHAGHKNFDAFFAAMAAKAAIPADFSIGVGDIFDLQYLTFFDIVAKYPHLLKDIFVKMKYYVPGNHDEELSKLSGIGGELHATAVRYPETIINVENMRWFITHGHLYGNLKWLFSLISHISDTKLFRKVAKWIVNRELLSNYTKHSVKYLYSIKQELINKALENKCDAVIFGHTHTPFVEKVTVDVGSTHKDIWIVNPGCMLKRPTYAVWENNQFVIKEQ